MSSSRLGWSGLLSRGGGAGESKCNAANNNSTSNKKSKKTTRRSNWEEIITVVTPLSNENNNQGTTTTATNTPVVIVSSSSSSSGPSLEGGDLGRNDEVTTHLQQTKELVNHQHQSPFSPSSSSSLMKPSLCNRRAYTTSLLTTTADTTAITRTTTQSAALTSSALHYLTSPTPPANAKLLPLTVQYDINDALLGLFTSTYNNGHSSLAYAVGTRYVEVALYQIPQHDYYYYHPNEETNEEYNNNNADSTMNQSDRTTAEETLFSPTNNTMGNRRTQSAANALWVTSLLGGMMTTATTAAAATTTTTATTTSITTTTDDEDVVVVDERMETLRKLAIEARKAFEEALDEEHQQQQQHQKGGDVDEDVRNSRIRFTQQQQQQQKKRKGGERRADEADDIFTTWKEYIRNKGGTGGFVDHCGSLDGISFDNICSFWNNACPTTTTTSDDDDNMMMMDDNNNDKRKNKRNTNKIDVASLPELPGPIELPQVFIRREEKVVETSDVAERMLMEYEEGVNDSCPLDVIDPNSRRRSSNVITTTNNTTSTAMKMDMIVTSPTATSYDNALNLNNDEIMSMEIDGTYSIMTEEPACPPTTTTTITNQEEIKGTISSSLSAVARARQLLSHRHRTTDGSGSSSSSNQKLQLQRHISVDSSGFDKDALQMALDLSIQQQQQQQSSIPPIYNIGDEVNVVSSSSSDVTLGSKMEVVEGSNSPSVVVGNFDSVMSMTLLYREQYHALHNRDKFHIHFLNTYQGRNPSTTNGCTVIAPLTCVQYFTSSEEEKRDELSPWNDGIPDSLINYVIDEHAASILPVVRRKLRLDHDAFIIPSDVHDHLIDMGLLSTSQFVSVCGGNILDDNHLQSFKMSLLLLDDARERMRLKGRKIAATFFFHGHVIAFHVIRKNGKEEDVSIELIDSLPDPRTWVTRRPSNVGPRDRFSQSTPRWGNIRQQQDDNEDEWECARESDDNNGLSMNAVRVRCTDVEHFDTLIRHYACSKFSNEERQFMDTTAWEDNNGYCEYSFDPRVFQAFIWAESESM